MLVMDPVICSCRHYGIEISLKTLKVVADIKASWYIFFPLVCGFSSRLSSKLQGLEPNGLPDQDTEQVRVKQAMS